MSAAWKDMATTPLTEVDFREFNLGTAKARGAARGHDLRPMTVGCPGCGRLFASKLSVGVHRGRTGCGAS